MEAWEATAGRSGKGALESEYLPAYRALRAVRAVQVRGN